MSELRFMTAGESHGPCLTAILEGLPAGLKLDLESINKDLARRQQGYGRGGRMKIEKDKVNVLSGVRFNETIGGPITLQVVNRDFQNWGERMAAFGEPAGEKVTAARPGHADFTGIRKYDRTDVRDILERSSARETTMRVAVGAVCKEFLKALAGHLHRWRQGRPGEGRPREARHGHLGSQLLRRRGRGADEGKDQGGAQRG